MTTAQLVQILIADDEPNILISLEFLMNFSVCGPRIALPTLKMVSSRPRRTVLFAWHRKCLTKRA